MDKHSFNVADHELICRISVGSYGEVWLARSRLGRYRAVKIVEQARFESARPFQREFEGIEKFEPVSRIHEGLVDILQVGRAGQEVFYYVMELADDQVKGQHIEPASYRARTLESEAVVKGRLPIPECVQIGIQLCQTLAFLHEQGLIHRDIKPSNVIFVDNQPKLADIGLIADMRDAKTYVGTTGFIPPEGPNSPQADIYSLGKLLYEISSGRDRNDFPSLPDQLGFADDFLELNEVLLQACHPDAHRRYPSALAMESDLRMIAGGKSVRRLRVLEARLTRIRRIGVVLGIALVVAGALYFEWNRTTQLHQQEKERHLGGKVAEGIALMNQGDYLSALPALVEAWRLEDKPGDVDLNHRLRIGSLLAASPKVVRTWKVADSDLRSCSIVGHTVLATVQYKSAQIFDLRTGQALSGPLAQDAQPYSSSFTPDGRAILTANWDSTARLVDWEKDRTLLKLTHPLPVLFASMSGDGQTIITACQDGHAYLWDRAGQPLGRLEGHTQSLFFAKLNPKGTLAVTAGVDSTARLWDVASKRALQVFPHKEWVYTADISPDERLVVTACYDGQVRLWDVRTGEEIEPPLQQSSAAMKAEFNHDGTRILTVSLDGTVRLWTRRTHQLVDSNHTLRHRLKLLDASLDATGTHLVASSADGTLVLWSFENLPAQPTGMGHRALVPDGEPTSPPGADWEVLTNVPPRLILRQRHTQHTIRVPAPAAAWRRFNRQQTRFAAVDGTNVHLVDLEKKRVHVLNHPEAVDFLDFSPDGLKLVCASGNKSLNPQSAQIWNAVTGTPLGPPLRHEDGVLRASFSPDSRQVVTASEDASAVVWDALTGKAITPKLLHREKVRDASFARLRPWVVTASEDATAIVWDAKSGERLTPAFRHSKRLARAEFIEADAALLTTDESGDQWRWPLPLESRAPEVVARQVESLAGRRSASE